MMTKPTRQTAVKVIELLSYGLVQGVGEPKPGKMCVEAAVNFALGLPHGDNPPCVSTIVRGLKISLNDSNWSSPIARADGLRRLAIAQLGSDKIDNVLFVKELALATVRKIVPIALRAAAKVHQSDSHKAALEKCAVMCESSEDLVAARSAADAASAASAASYAAAAADAAFAAFAASASAADASASASAADAAASADAARSAAAASDKVLGIMAECAVEALIVCKSPGCKWLDLTTTV